MNRSQRELALLLILVALLAGVYAAGTQLAGVVAALEIPWWAVFAGVLLLVVSIAALVFRILRRTVLRAVRHALMAKAIALFLAAAPLFLGWLASLPLPPLPPI